MCIHVCIYGVYMNVCAYICMCVYVYVHMCMRGIFVHVCMLNVEMCVMILHFIFSERISYLN